MKRGLAIVWIPVLCTLALARHDRLSAADPIAAAPRDPSGTPRIFPDYTRIVVPPNIAPLNFSIREPGQEYRVILRGSRGESITRQSRRRGIRLPIGPWRELLRQNAGQEYYVDVAVRQSDGSWQQWNTITNRVAAEPMDSYLVYRLIRPLYNFYREVGIYQRELESFDERSILENRSFDRGCVNCHTFNRQSPDTMALNIRSPEYGRPLLIVNADRVRPVPRTAGYLSWHPRGDLIAFSQNKLSLLFHTVGENRDVFDAASDLAIYDLRSDTVAQPEPIADPARLETWPEWDAQGRYLYFSSCAPRPIAEFASVQYDLMRIPYDPSTGRWGTVQTVLSAAQTGRSITQPKASPDGRFLLFCMSAYGNFPVYQPSSDLYLMDLETREYRRLECNSDQCESWHAWSSNSRWIVFSSKRVDQVFARPHFSYIDSAGHASKALVMPQADPAFYDSYIKTYNLPQFVTGPIKATPAAFTQAIVNPPRQARGLNPNTSQR